MTNMSSRVGSNGRGMRTFEIALESGRPPSRAKDQSCREDAASSLMTLQVSVMITIATMVFVPA